MKTNLFTSVWVIALFGLPILQLPAQTTVSNGNHLIILAGTRFTSLQNVNVSDGGNLMVNGVLTLKKDLVNQNGVPTDLGSGTAEFSGTVPQAISGQNAIQNLLLNNTAGLTIGGDTRINGVFTLISGLVTLGSNNLLIGPSGTVAGTFSSSSMVVPNGSGELRKEFPGGGSFTFPVGDATGTAEYSPVILNFTSGSFPAGNYAGVALTNAVYPDPGITVDYLNRYWNVSQSNISGFNCNAIFQYTSGDVTGNEASLSCTRVYPQPWHPFGSANTSLHQFTAAGIVEFGSFTGVKNTTVPINQDVATTNIENGITGCFDATQILTVGGNGNAFGVTNGGSASLIAGQKVSLLPGTTVFLNGCLHGYISNNGIYCNTVPNPMVTNPVAMSDPEGKVPPFKSQLIEIYPNPTSDKVMIEISQAFSTSIVNIDMFNMNGRHLISKIMQGGSKQEFSLAGLPSGTYILHVWTDGSSQVAKIIIKQ